MALVHSTFHLPVDRSPKYWSRNKKHERPADSAAAAAAVVAVVAAAAAAAASDRDGIADLLSDIIYDSTSCCILTIVPSL